MKTYKLLLSLLVGVLAALSVLAVLSLGTATAGTLHEWVDHWYWKDGGWTDYAPSGVPDFDQKQDCWGIGGCPAPGIPPARWTYCGPVAAANSLWWFDSKLEPSPLPPPVPPNDNYYLITAYQPGHDDHDPMNVGGMAQPGLVDDLAWYFDTDGFRSGAPVVGTEVHAMSYGLQWYLYGNVPPDWGMHPYGPPLGRRYVSYYDDYHVQLVKMPTFDWVEAEVERSEDVILLLGFWQWQDPDGVPGNGDERWVRLGGHYVTVAGINSTDHQIAFSDPFFDNAEARRPGRVLSGTLFLPHQPGHTSDFHNDAGNVSHDVYTVTLTPVSPGGLWEIVDYPYDPSDPNFEEQNVPKEFVPDQGTFNPAFLSPVVEVEYAIAMSPFHWKPGGEWVWLYYRGEWMWEWWPYEDDGDSCLPDFWWMLDATWQAYDGPVAVANSLWWFDSKAETLLTGGWPQEPPDVSDHYNLVGSYGEGEWDDHAVTNTTYLIDDLAQNYLSTAPTGTTPEDMAAGIGTYLAARGVANDFYTKTQDAPSFEWVADEVETSEDVLLLLGFYERTGEGLWERKGGHWVNVAGVNRENDFVGLSDPALDNAASYSISNTLYLGRVFPPERLGKPFTDEEKKAPQNISHDIYSTTMAIVSAGQWALVDYPVTSVLTDFVGLNGGGTDVEEWEHPFETVVEWAIGVSPYSDLVITKTAVVTEVMPGDRITYTLEYANVGLAAVDTVTITDVLPLDYLTDVAYTAWPPLQATPAVTYVWTLPRLTYGQRGFITVTAASRVTATLANTAHITGLNAIGDPTPDRDPNDNTAIVCDPVGNVDFQYTPSAPQVSQVIAFTASATGSSPITYTWSADDGWSATGSTTSHAFAAGGGHTVWLTATNLCGQDYASQGIFVREYGVDLQPDSGGTTENPNKTVTYTLTLYNTGNVADNYLVTGAVSGQPWTTTWPTLALPVAAGGNTQLNVTVQIPASATSGQWSRAAITATSQGDKSKWDTSTLTTTAYVGTITRRVEVAPQTATGNGDPGGTVTYTLRVTNTGSVADVIGLSHSGPALWTVAYSANPLSLGAGLGTDVQAYVGIPSSAPGGSTGVITVTAASQADPTQDDEAVLTTHVGWRFVYLPVVLRNY